jgi:hypothetical protein
MTSLQRNGLATLAFALAVALAGCGTPGAPQPPSLNLVDPVADLSASRTGNQVSLSWTMPKKNTDKVLLKGNVDVRVCQRGQENTACEPVGSALSLAPGAAGNFEETLHRELASGTPRLLTFYVELRNRRGRSAGLSNGAPILAGEAPASVAGLAADVRKDGIVLHWALDNEQTAIRLRRILLTPPSTKQQNGLLKAPAEPLQEDLLIKTDEKSGGQEGRAIDKGIHLGQTYEYRAQRVSRIEADGKTLELAGEWSQPVRVEAIDVFPPAVPTGLAAVASPGEGGAPSAIDLSWQPDTEADLLGYVVYRREGDGPWQRISPATPGIAPAFHDAQVQPGHSYSYAVSAVDRGGHESERSSPAEESVPNP